MQNTTKPNNITQAGGLLVFLGGLSCIFRLFDYDISILLWTDMWGNDVGWIIRIGMVIIGAILIKAGKNFSDRQKLQSNNDNFWPIFFTVFTVIVVIFLNIARERTGGVSGLFIELFNASFNFVKSHKHGISIFGLIIAAIDLLGLTQKLEMIISSFRNWLNSFTVARFEEFEYGVAKNDIFTRFYRLSESLILPIVIIWIIIGILIYVVGSDKLSMPIIWFLVLLAIISFFTIIYTRIYWYGRVIILFIASFFYVVLRILNVPPRGTLATLGFIMASIGKLV